MIVLTILAEPLKNSELVSMTLWVISAFFGVLSIAVGLVGKLIADKLSIYQDRFIANENAIKEGLEKVSKTLEHGFDVAFGRIDALEKFKAKIETLHTINHNQDF